MSAGHSPLVEGSKTWISMFGDVRTVSVSCPDMSGGHVLQPPARTNIDTLQRGENPAPKLVPINFKRAIVVDTRSPS